MIRPILLTSSAITLILAAAASAQAATCTSSGTSFTCTAPASAPVASSAANSSVTVTATGAVVSTSKSTAAIAMSGNAATVNNAGIVAQTDTANNGRAITGSGTGLTITNSGTISSGDRAIEMLSGSGLNLTNEVGAEITARREAVLSLEGVTGATVVNNGLISSTTGRALQLRGNGATVINTGELLAGKEVLEARGDFTLENYGTIHLNAPTIEDEDGVQFASGTVLNAGLIEGTDDGIDLDEGTVTNTTTGIIRSVSADPTSSSNSGIDIDAEFDNGVDPLRPAGMVTVVNQGLIEGPSAIGADDASQSSVMIDNSGTLRGVGDFAIRLAPAQGDSTLRLTGNSVIDGGVRFGSGMDLVEIEGLTTSSLINGIFYGGDGTDTVSLNNYLLSDITGFSVMGDQVNMSFLSDGTLLSGTFMSFENWSVGGTSYSTAALASALATSPVPLPAGLPLLLSGLFGIAMLRRRRS